MAEGHQGSSYFLLVRPNMGGIPEIAICRILALMWSYYHEAHCIEGLSEVALPEPWEDPKNRTP